MTSNFFSLLKSAIVKRDSLLCVGIDPQNQDGASQDNYSRLKSFGEMIIDSTCDFTACYKPNIAFYEAYGPDGLSALKDTIRMIPENIPVIIDAKRGDIGNTAIAYARSIFGFFGAGAVTVNPYLGRDSVLPFLEWQDRGVFVLCRTSNRDSARIQECSVADNSGQLPYYLWLAREAALWGENVGLVVAGNLPGALKRVRELLPEIWLLAPGIGAQGGSAAQALEAGIRNDGSGILINVSRSICTADSPGRAAAAIRDQIRRARDAYFHSGPKRGGVANGQGQGGRFAPDLARKAKEKEKEKELIRALIRAECFRLGNFRLKSGQVSPFYIDLRMIISDPELLARVASAYAAMLEDLFYGRLAGIPFAGVPIATSVSLAVNKPLIFPRPQIKAHGRKRRIEGLYYRGDRVVLLDDLISSGTSKIEALEVLREEGLIVEDLVVLVERGRSGRKEMERLGIKLHSYLDLESFLDICFRMGKIKQAELESVREYLDLNDQ